MEKDQLLKSLAEVQVYKNAETSFLHSAENAGVIPFLENLHYVVGLFFCKSQESLKEGKELLYKLLHYMPEGQNLFPRTLADFPRAFDRIGSVKALFPLLTLHEIFRSVLSSEEKKLLESRIHRLHEMLENLLSEKVLHGLSDVVAWVAKCRLCLVFERPLPTERTFENFCFSSYSKDAIAELFVYLQTLPETFLPVFRKELTSYLMACTHDTLGYVGPLLSEQLVKGQTVPGLFEVICLGALPKELSQLCAFLRYAKGELKGDTTVTLHNAVKTSKSAITFVDKTLPGCNTHSRLFHPLFVQWMDSQEIGSLMLRVPRGEVSLVHLDPEKVICDISLPNAFIHGKREKDEEVLLYLKKIPGLSFLVDGKKATCFDLNDVIHIKTNTMHLELSMQMTHGNGDWKGHLALAYREVIDTKRLLEIEPEWKLFYRAVRRSHPLTLRFSLTITPL